MMSRSMSRVKSTAGYPSSLKNQIQQCQIREQLRGAVQHEAVNIYRLASFEQGAQFPGMSWRMNSVKPDNFTAQGLP